MGSYRVESERRSEVARWRASGQSATSYCAARGISGESLRRWRKELDRPPPAPAFVRVEVARRAPDCGLTLEVGRVRLRLDAGFDATLLREVVKALSLEVA